MPVMAPDLKEMSRPAASDLVAACAVRTLARTETFMPMKPAAPDSTAPIRKPIAASAPSRNQRPSEDDDADDGDGRVLAREIGLRAFGDRGGDLLHFLRAGVRRHHGLDRPNPINDRKCATADDGP